MTIGDRIKYQRKQMHMTQEDLAVKLGTTKQTIWKYEHNVVDFPLFRIQQLANVFGCTPEYLTGWDSEEKEKPAVEEDGRLSEEDVKLLELFHKLDAEEQEMVLDVVSAALRRHK